MISRRAIIGALALLGGAVAMFPPPIRAQIPIPVIGFLSGLSPGPNVTMTNAFLTGLAEIGYIEGRNVIIEYRWAEGQYDRLPDLAADLVRRNVSVIVSSGGVVTALEAKRATENIPIVFTGGDDPVRDGLVASLARPGSNITGASVFAEALVAKRIELLHELVPAGSPIAVLLNPQNPSTAEVRRITNLAAQILGHKLYELHVDTAGGIDEVFSFAVRQHVSGVITTADPLIRLQNNRLVEISAKYGLPVVDVWREFAVGGGLMSYGPNLSAVYRQVGLYTGRILKGEKPSDLPVVQPTTLELVVNLRTAKMLDLKIPPSILARADEVIE